MSATTLSPSAYLENTQSFYNENDPRIARDLNSLRIRNLIPDGTIDTRSITEIRPDELTTYDQCHFFAGIGGWIRALQLASIPPETQLWTGSCPCQPFSIAGKGKGNLDSRHLWPAWFNLVKARRPPVIFGEQVTSKAAFAWFSGVRSDLESIEYAVGAANLCAYAIGAPHERQRTFWVAYASGNGQERIQRRFAAQVSQNWPPKALDAWRHSSHPFEQWSKLMAQPHVCRMADGVSSGLDVRPRLHAYGNAIVSQLAACFIEASFEAIYG